MAFASERGDREDHEGRAAPPLGAGPLAPPRRPKPSSPPRPITRTSPALSGISFPPVRSTPRPAVTSIWCCQSWRCTEVCPPFWNRISWSDVFSAPSSFPTSCFITTRAEPISPKRTALRERTFVRYIRRANPRAPDKRFAGGSPAVVPAERVQGGRLPLPRSGVGALGEDDAVVAVPERGHELALNPARSTLDDGQARGAARGLHLAVLLVEHALRAVLHALAEEGDRGRIRASHIRNGTAVLKERKRDQRWLERSLQDPREEHEVVLSVLHLRPHHVRTVRD